MTQKPKLIYDTCASSGCNFFVKHDQEFCPNCGTKQDNYVPEVRYKEPIPPPFEETPKSGWASFFTVITGSLALLGIPVTIAGLISGLLWLLGFAVSGLLVALVILGPIMFKVFGRLTPSSKNENDEKEVISDPLIPEPVKPIRMNPTSLDSSMFKMGERLNDIGQKRQKLTSLIEKFELNDKEREEKIETKLKRVSEILAEQSSRYQVKIKEIDFLRWQNQLAPIIANIRSQSYEGAESGLKRLSELAETGRTEFEDLARWVSMLEHSAAGRNLLQRFKETLDSCVKLRDALLEHQAMLVIKDVTPLGEDDKLFFTIPPELVRNVEAFNAEASINDFTVSVDALDQEFERLEIEDKLSKDSRLLMEQSENL